MKSSKQFKASLLNNIKLNKPIWNNSYSLKPMKDETTWYPNRWWTDDAFKVYPSYAHTMIEFKCLGMVADSYLFSDIDRNIMPMYRLHYGIYGALVFQYLDARNYYWQSLPF